MNIPKKIFTNEHLELFSSGQIRIPNKTIQIPQVTFQFWSFSSKFEKGDSNPSNNDSNPHSKKFRLKKPIRIPHIAIQIHISKSLDRQRRFEFLMKRFESSSKRFKFHVKKEEMLRATDSNHLFSDSNLS